MKIYSIIRVGHEYVVQADEQSVLKIASRRKAVRIVSDAAELLDSQMPPPLSPAAHAAASIACDPWITHDFGIAPEPGISHDSEMTPDPSKVP